MIKLILCVGAGGGSGSNYAGGVPNAAIDALKVKIANNAGLLQELTSLIAQGGAASSAGAAALASSAAGNQGEFSTFIMILNIHHMTEYFTNCIIAILLFSTAFPFLPKAR